MVVVVSWIALFMMVMMLDHTLHDRDGDDARDHTLHDRDGDDARDHTLRDRGGDDVHDHVLPWHLLRAIRLQEIDSSLRFSSRPEAARLVL